MKNIKLIVGLGNPGIKYDKTRHNIGFDFIDQLCDEYSFTLQTNTKFYGLAHKVNLFGKEIWLLKPQTFMNLSGKSVASLANFYKIDPSEILVAYDELDLPPGTAKLKQGGGHGGHNGLRDIISMTGSSNFYRLRLGIGHPGHKSKVVSWVLSRASTDDEILLSHSIKKSMQALEDIIKGNYEKAMKDLHTNN
jgi:PTH1 family peptidyl-tRNA hydrolase